jgi:hypothetical protein
MFIFDDLVIVAASLSEKSGLFASKKKGSKSALRVLAEHEGGIGKVLEVKDWSGWQGMSSLPTSRNTLTSRPYLIIRVDNGTNVLYSPEPTHQPRHYSLYPATPSLT